MPCDADGGLGRFVRSLVGPDQAAAKQAFAGFLDGKVLTADQLEFIDLIVDHLTARGVMDPKLLYEGPFTDFDSNGVEGVFNSADAAILVKTLRDLEATRHKPLSNRSVDNVNVTALSRILRATDPHDKISWVGRRNPRCLDRK